MAPRSGSGPSAADDVWRYDAPGATPVDNGHDGYPAPGRAPAGNGHDGYGTAGAGTGVGASGPDWGPPVQPPAAGGPVPDGRVRPVPPPDGPPSHPRPPAADAYATAAAPPPRGAPRASVAPTVRPPVPDAPSPDLVFTRRVRPVSMLRELLGSGELVRALTERDFRARYKQTKVGFAWALLTPLLLMVAFSLFFKTAADIDTGDIPYPLFSFVALVPWTLFSNSVSTGAVSITQNLSLVNKVYCPREVFPLSSIGIAGVDAAISLLMLGVLFVVYGEAPQPESVWVLVLLPIQLAFTIGVTLLLSALVVYLRDVRQILPMALQFALFATPVAYAFDVLEEKWQPLASAVNPLAPIIDSYRQTILYGQAPQGDLLAIAAGVSLLWLVGGYLLFKRLETGFADVA